MCVRLLKTEIRDLGPCMYASYLEREEKNETKLVDLILSMKDLYIYTI